MAAAMADKKEDDVAQLNAIKMALRMGHSLLKYQVEFLVAMTERAIATPPEIAGLADKLEEIASYDPPFDCEVFYQAAAALRARAVPDELPLFDAAIAVELPCVSVVPYNSKEICTWFAKNVRERMLAASKAGGE